MINDGRTVMHGANRMRTFITTLPATNKNSPRVISENLIVPEFKTRNGRRTQGFK